MKYNPDMNSAPKNRPIMLRCVEDGAQFTAYWNEAKGVFVNERTGLQVNPILSTYEWKTPLRPKLKGFLVDFEKLIVNMDRANEETRDNVIDCHTSIEAFFELPEVKKVMSIF